MQSIEMIRLVNDTPPEELQQALKSNPVLITTQDEHGRTLLHHAALFGTSYEWLRRVGDRVGSEIISAKLNILLDAPGVDFSIKDLMGDTAVHLAAMSAVTRITCTHLFPAFIKKAAEHGFDFMTLNSSAENYNTQRKKLRGLIPGPSRLTDQFEKTVLQLSIVNSIYNQEGGNDAHYKKVLTALTNAPNQGLDVLSESGKGGTAFYYAIQRYRLDEAKLLLDAGANPVIFGRKEYDPITLLPQRLNYATEMLASARRCTPICDDDFFSSIEARDAENKRLAGIRTWIEIIDKTKALMNHPRLTSSIEIRKNARILAQGVRGGSIFSTLPTELLIKIAGHTGTPRSHSTEDAEEIARQNLGKPPL